MASKHRRIALTADPELEAAIAAARRELGDAAEARLVRELALRGARDLGSDPTVRAIGELKRAGARWPAHSLADSLTSDPPLEEAEVTDPYRGTHALDEVRVDRV